MLLRSVTSERNAFYGAKLLIEQETVHSANKQVSGLFNVYRVLYREPTMAILFLYSDNKRQHRHKDTDPHHSSTPHNTTHTQGFA